MPGITATPCFKVNVAGLRVAGSIASQKVTESLLLTGTATAALAGTVELRGRGDVVDFVDLCLPWKHGLL